MVSVGSSSLMGRSHAARSPKCCCNPPLSVPRHMRAGHRRHHHQQRARGQGGAGLGVFGVLEKQRCDV